MSARRKHYRVARKEIQPIEDNGLYLSRDQKAAFSVTAIFLMLLVLIESVLLGYIIIRNYDED
ncbi:MAG: hypothetical protein LBU32_27265 [Clostridiales bacterium]|jgi:hypothetical protein|nr:hypothetical protein [Clostridiales bacterium]